jgi:hypothetical protein
MPPLHLQHIMSNAFLAGIFEHLTIHSQRFKTALILLLKEIILCFKDGNLICKQGLLLPICIVLMRPES